MSDKQALNREALIKVTNLIKPAVSTTNYIPALTHIMFDGEWATAYNDISAISVRIDTDVDACLPGELLTRTLASFSAEKIMFQSTGNEMVVSSGRSKIKMPILPSKDFPLKWPDLKKGAELEIDANVIKGIERCLVSVGTDPTHPAQMGVTLDVDGKGHAVLFSTDNFTVSRFQTKTEVSLPGDAPVILPTFFCQQLMILAKAFPEAEVTVLSFPGVIVAEIGKSATLLTKTLVDVEPLDFHRIINKHVPNLGDLPDLSSTIPDGWEGAFSRALLVLGGEVDKATKLTASADLLKLASSSAMGEANEALDWEGGEHTTDPFYIDPSLVMRASKACSSVYLGPAAMVMTDGQKAGFLHLIAHCSK